MKKLRIKPLVLTISFVLIVTTIVLTSGILVTTPLINAAGSSAVQPLMATISNKYSKSDLVTQAGGSGVGIRSVIDGSKDIGMASKNPGVIKKIPAGQSPSADQVEWIKREIKTVTIAWDGMGLVYKTKNPNTIVDVNEENIKNIYTAFAGNVPIKFSDIGVQGDDTIIIPYARSGGAKVSGTADAFYKDSHLNYDVTPIEKEKLNSALVDGVYGNYTKTTAEANSQAWSFVKNENKIGSMVYLSAGFINNNREEIKAAGFEIATYKGVTIDLVNIAQDYGWYRPLNLMLSIKRDPTNEPGIINHAPSQELINWIIYEQNPIAKNIIETEGYVNLTIDDIKKNMCLNNDLSTFWSATDELIFNQKNGIKTLKENNE